MKIVDCNALRDPRLKGDDGAVGCCGQKKSVLSFVNIRHLRVLIHKKTPAVSRETIYERKALEHIST